MKIKISVNERSVAREFDKFLNRAKNRGPAMAAIAATMLSAVEDNFRAEGRPHWEKLAGSTLAQRRMKGQSGKIGQATGNMARSVTPFSSIYQAGVGTNVPYARFFQFGTRPHTITAKKGKTLAFMGAKGKMFRKSVKHPGTKPRPFLSLADRDRDIIIEIMRRHIAGNPR